MKFETSERITTDRSEAEVLDFAFTQFKKVSQNAKQKDDIVLAKGIEATFGSANHADKTVISTRRTDDGILIVADTQYRPSVFFWVITIALLFTWVGWIFPIIFYLTQKTSVRKAVESCLRRVKDEATRQPKFTASIDQQPSAMDELSKLADLKERGFITDEEFAAKKVQFLRAR